MLGEIVCDSSVIGLHRFLAGSPIGGANLPVLLEEIKRIHHTQSLIHAAAQRQIVDDLMPDRSLPVDEKKPAVGDHFRTRSKMPVVIHAKLPVKHVEGRGDRAVGIRDQRVLDALDSPMIFRRLQPRPMALLGIRGYPDHSGVTALKLGELFLKRVQFGRTHEREILGIEKEHDVFLPKKLVQGEVGDEFAAVNDSGSGKMRGFFTNEYGHGF